MLFDLGYRVVECDSAEQSFHLIDQGLVPDVVVTDHLMPGMSGTDLAAVLVERCVPAKTLFVSGYAEDEGVNAALPRLIRPFLQAGLASKLVALDEEQSC